MKANSTSIVSCALGHSLPTANLSGWSEMLYRDNTKCLVQLSWFFCIGHLLSSRIIFSFHNFLNSSSRALRRPSPAAVNSFKSLRRLRLILHSGTHKLEVVRHNMSKLANNLQTNCPQSLSGRKDYLGCRRLTLWNATLVCQPTGFQAITSSKMIPVYQR